MKNKERIASLLDDVGNLMLSQLGLEQGNVWLYAEVEPGMIAPSMYVDEGETVTYVEPQKPLYDRIFDLWYAAPDEEKWASLSYEISGTKVRAEFGYSDDWPEDEHSFERRGRAVRERFQGKKIVYPPLEGGQSFEMG